MRHRSVCQSYDKTDQGKEKGTLQTLNFKHGTLNVNCFEMLINVDYLLLFPYFFGIHQTLYGFINAKSTFKGNFFFLKEKKKNWLKNRKVPFEQALLKNLQFGASL